MIKLLQILSEIKIIGNPLSNIQKKYDSLEIGDNVKIKSSEKFRKFEFRRWTIIDKGVISRKVIGPLRSFESVFGYNFITLRYKSIWSKNPVIISMIVDLKNVSGNKTDKEFLELEKI